MLIEFENGLVKIVCHANELYKFVGNTVHSPLNSWLYNNVHVYAHNSKTNLNMQSGRVYIFWLLTTMLKYDRQSLSDSQLSSLIDTCEVC